MKTNLFIIIALSILLLLSATTPVRESNLKRVQPDKPISTLTYCELLHQNELYKVNDFINRNALNGYIVKTADISAPSYATVSVLIVMEKYDIHKWE